MSPRFPWLTHVFSAVLLAGWMVVGEAAAYGISTTDGWWPSDAGVVLFLVAWWLLPAVLLALAEAWLLLVFPSRWPARIVGIVSTLGCAFVGFVPVMLRFAGDESPAKGQDITLSLVSFGVLVTAQIIVGSSLSRLHPRRSPLSAGH